VATHLSHLDPHNCLFQSFQFPKLYHSLLFLAVFRVLNFQSCFEALNDVFWEIWGQHGSMDRCFPTQRCSARIDLSNELLNASNGDRMPKLRPREIDVPIYPNGAHNLAFHLLGLGFGMLRVFHCFSTINRPSSLIVTQSLEQFRGM